MGEVNQLPPFPFWPTFEESFLRIFSRFNSDSETNNQVIFSIKKVFSVPLWKEITQKPSF